MKKILLKRMMIFLILIAIAFCFAMVYVPSNPTYAMELTGDESDTVFWENLFELYQDCESDYLTVKADKEIVFDINLAQLGYVYDFEVNGNSGYAIVLKTNEKFVVTEMFFDSINPYKDTVDGEKIYVAFMTYLKYNNGDYKLADGTILTEEAMNKLSGIAYYSNGGGLTSSSITIYYTNRNEDKYNLATRHPGITEVGGLANACAAIAGANIIQFWDRYQVNLIADYTPGSSISSSYLYKGISETLNSVVRQLYSDMETNSTGNGATIPQFKNGMTKYANRQGYTATFNTCMSNGSFSYNIAKQKLVAGQPLALFLDTYTIGSISQGDNYDQITYFSGNGTHVMAGFGYKEVEYTLSSGGTRKDNYIAVASGASQCAKGFFNINYNTVIDDAYGVLIA